MYTNPHIVLAQMRYQQADLRARSQLPRRDQSHSSRRHWTALYVRSRKLTLPANNAGALVGSIPTRP